MELFLFGNIFYKIYLSVQVVPPTVSPELDSHKTYDQSHPHLSNKRTQTTENYRKGQSLLTHQKQSMYQKNNSLRLGEIIQDNLTDKR